MGAVAPGHHEAVGLDLLEQPQGLQVRDDPRPCLVAVQPPIGGGHQLRGGGTGDALGVGRHDPGGIGRPVPPGPVLEGRALDPGVHREDVDEAVLGHLPQGGGVPVPQPHLVVVEVVGRGDLDHPGAELRVHVLVGDDGDVTAGQGELDVLADQVSVALVAGVNGHRRVPQHRLGAGGGDREVPRPVHERIAHVPHGALLLLGYHLEVGDGRVQHRVPVDEPLATVEQPLLVELDEDLRHRPREALVHGEALGFPVERGTHAPQLPGDGPARLGAPLPDPREEGLAPQVVAGAARGVQLTLHHHLGGDPRVVGARLPEGRVPLHPVVAHERVHDGVLERVAHVQRPGHVGRRDHDAVGGAVTPGREMAAGLPGLVPALLDRVGVVGLVHGVPVQGPRRVRLISSSSTSGSTMSRCCFTRERISLRSRASASERVSSMMTSTSLVSRFSRSS